MRLKSTVWALAFACAAVSCSDDLEGGPNTENGQELTGPKTYINVTVSTGAVTKAPDGGEGTGTEVGDKSEYNIEDVTVILFDNRDNADQAVAASFNFLATSKLKGIGFATVTDADQGASGTDQHGRQATVEVLMNEEDVTSLNGKDYGVIAVTNLGGTEQDPNDLIDKIKAKTDPIDTGKELAEYLQKDRETSGFVMSTHTMAWPEGGTPTSVVTIKAGATENDAPSVTSYVERLAAKIRIKPAAADTDKEFIYSTPSADKETAKVRLDQVVVVNQLNSKSYLLKHVTDNDPQFDDTDEITYLGQEAWVKDNNASTNSVLDPWTTSRDENATMPSSPASLSYLNPFAQRGTETSTILNFMEGWAKYATETSADTKVKNLATAATTDYNENEGASIRLAYTQENVTQSTHSLNGYSTGALFKATYLPKLWIEVQADGSTKADVEVDYNGETTGTGYDDIDPTTTGKSFYTYMNEKGMHIYGSQAAIFAERINKTLSEEAKKTLNYTDFATQAEFEKLTVADFNTHFKDMSEPFGYIKALNDAITAKGTLTGKETMKDIPNAKIFTDFVDETKTYGNARYFENGVCYYPYWIRHANNDNNNNMGMMEFAIVRNNIYELEVTGITKLGLSGTDVPDPEDPDENGEASINVALRVKNWVVRSNSGIIF